MSSTNKTKSKSTVILMRNTEQKVIQPEVYKYPVKCLVYKNDVIYTKPFNPPSEKSDENVKEPPENHLSKPELHSTLHVAKNIKTVCEKKLSPKEIWDKIAADQAAKRLNFKPEERIYKDLINLSLSSESVESIEKKPSSSRSKTYRKRDISPRLEDYLKPVKFECIKPKFVLPKMPPREPVTVFDYDSVRRHMDRWENADQFSTLCRYKF